MFKQRERLDWSSIWGLRERERERENQLSNTRKKEKKQKKQKKKKTKQNIKRKQVWNTGKKNTKK